MKNEDEVRALYRRAKMAGDRKVMAAIKDVVSLLAPALDVEKGSEASVEMSRRMAGPTTLETRSAEEKHRRDYEAYVRQLGVHDE